MRYPKRSEGVDKDTFLRLVKFHELNVSQPTLVIRAYHSSPTQTIRILFRLLFCVSIVILGADGVRPHSHINENM